MRSPHLRSPARPVVLAATLLSVSGAAALAATMTAPSPAPDPNAQARAREQAVQGAIALVHDGAGFSADLPTGTFSDGKPDTRPEIAQAARKVPEVIAAAIKRLDPAAPPAADRANEAAKLRLATFAGEHSFRRALAWYEPLLLEVAPDMPEPKLTPEQLKTLRTQIREWQAKSSTYREWAQKKGGDFKPAVPAKPANGNPVTGPFSDVPTAHPAYGAVRLMHQSGLFTGYPDNTFSGKRALTRYEFAVALQRTLQDLQRAVAAPKPAEGLPAPKPGGNPGFRAEPVNLTAHSPLLAPSLQLTRGPIGIAGPDAPKPASLDPARLPYLVAWLRALSEEFDTELAMLGADVAQMKKTLEEFQQRAERLKVLIAPNKPQEAVDKGTL